MLLHASTTACVLQARNSLPRSKRKFYVPTVWREIPSWLPLSKQDHTLDATTTTTQGFSLSDAWVRHGAATSAKSGEGLGVCDCGHESHCDAGLTSHKYDSCEFGWCMETDTASHRGLHHTAHDHNQRVGGAGSSPRQYFIW